MSFHYPTQSLCLVVFFLGLTFAQTSSDCTDVIESLNQTCPTTPNIAYYYPDPEHCSKYWQCLNGCAYNLECRDDYLYDENEERCRSPAEVSCGDRPCDGRPCATNPPTEATTTTDENSQTTPNGESTTDSGDFECPEDGWFPDPKNCIKYYHCYGGSVDRLVCPIGDNGEQELYDPEQIWCDYPDRVDCGDRPICDVDDENCYMPTPPPPTPCDDYECTGSQFIAQGPCEQCFCECNSIAQPPEQLCCEDGLFFYPQMKYCDWPYNNPGCSLVKNP